MSFSDPIADMLTRIRNGQQARKKSVSAPYSKYKENIVSVLLSEGYIRSYHVDKDDRGHPSLVIELKYMANGPVLKMIKRISKPGRRVYSSIKDLSLVRNGLGINILSTPKGVLSDVEARKCSVGGEVICSVF